MNPLLRKLTPSATDQIRADHAHLLITFHQYHADTPAATKQALVKAACLGLEIHAELEEEIFYPAVREALTEEQVVDREVIEHSVPEHNEMRKLIEELRAMEPTDVDYDRTFLQLMRDVMHHVADEESVLLPAAERLPADRFDRIGIAMAQRRLQLASRRAGEATADALRTLPTSTLLVAAGAALTGGLLVQRVLRRRGR